MARVLIVGYGNPLRSDDGLGWRAAEELSRCLSLPEVEVLMRQQLTPELADNLTRADVVFFIDAARGGQPGELRCDPVTPQPGTTDTHHSSPAGILGHGPAALRRQSTGFCSLYVRRMFRSRYSALRDRGSRPSETDRAGGKTGQTTKCAALPELMVTPVLSAAGAAILSFRNTRRVLRGSSDAQSQSAPERAHGWFFHVGRPRRTLSLHSE